MSASPAPFLEYFGYADRFIKNLFYFMERSVTNVKYYDKYTNTRGMGCKRIAHADSHFIDAKYYNYDQYSVACVRKTKRAKYVF